MTTIVSALFLFPMITSCFCQQEYIFGTQSPHEIDTAVTPWQLFVVVDENTGEAKVTCSVKKIPDFDTPVQTYWELVETSEFLTFDDNGVAVNYAYISVSGDNNEIMTISDFQVEMDRLQISCKGNQSSTESVLITFGFKGIVVFPTRHYSYLTHFYMTVLQLDHYGCCKPVFLALLNSLPSHLI